MNKLIITLAVALLWPATSFAQINVPHVFLGFTSATFNGGWAPSSKHVKRGTRRCSGSRGKADR